jgi:LysR family transcriptional regulator, benzoate and cis,cis-muconate-responsive activator of ben and cat genes
MELDLECVASFLILCEEEHFGRAATRLHLTSPALSKRLQRLEHQVGARLIDRGPTGTTALTAAGWQFADHATVVMDQARAAQAAARAAAHTPIRAVVRIGVPGIISAQPLTRSLTGPIHTLRERIPGVEIQCIGVPYGSTLDCLLNDMVDILWSPAQIQRPALESRPLGTVMRVGVVPDRHPLAEAGAVNVEDFAGLPLLHHGAVPLSSMPAGWLADIRPLAQARLVTTNAQSVSALRQEILRGQGVAIMPLPLGLEAGPGLQTITLHEVPATQIHALYRRAEKGSLIQEVLGLLQAVTSPRGSPHLDTPPPTSCAGATRPPATHLMT